MSCGGEHEVPCEDFLAEIYLLLDCECEERRREQLDRHLRECHPCLEEFDLERDLKSLVRRGCSGEKAPEQLRLRLQAQIRQAVGGTVTRTVASVTETVVGDDVAVTRRVTVTRTDVAGGTPRRLDGPGQDTGQGAGQGDRR